MAPMRENQTATRRQRRRPPPLSDAGVVASSKGRSQLSSTAKQKIRRPDEIDNLDEMMLQFPSSSPMRFLPISSPSAEEHGYQINVSKDGSMITAVPIVEPHKRRNGFQRLKPTQQPSSILLEPRRSPIMFGQSARSSPVEEVSGQGLLDARNKQRTKMKRFVSRPIISSPKKGSTPKLTTISSSSNSSDSRSKRFLAFTRKNNSDSKKKLAIHPIPQPSNDVHIAAAIAAAAAATAAPRRKSKVTWDIPTPSTNNRQQPMSGMDDAESVSSFPYLSPTHKFDDDITSSGIRFSPFLHDNEKEIDQRMSEIQYERDELAKEMHKRDLIRGTIINAINTNLLKKREKIKLLDEELKQIKQMQQKQQQQSRMTTSQQRKYNDPDPIITADSDSVAERAAEEAKTDAKMTTKGTIGLDPPARRSPPYSPNEIPLQYQYQQLWEEHQALLKQTQKRGGENGKIVHFDVPSYESDSIEHRYERHHMDSRATSSRGVMFSSMEEQEEQQFNVDEYLSDLGSLVSSDHNGMHYDPDIYSVAAVVIQTAIRRFLAEIAVEERQYAVQVIQSAICTWWTRMMWDRESHDAPSQAFYTLYDEREPISHNNKKNNNVDKHNNNNNNRNYIDNNDESLQRSNPIIFEDDSYQDFRDFAATEIQRCYRGWWEREGLEIDHFAALTIQRNFRGWWAREVLDVNRYCATEIQRIVRGHLTKMSFIFDTYCIIVAQSVIRRFLSFHTSAVRLASILYIQALFRGYRVRAELRNYVQTGQEVASTIIQAQWRSYDAQMTYINTLADILIVQSIARRWFTIMKIGRKSTREKVRHDKRSETKNAGNKPKTLISSLRLSVKYTAAATKPPTTNMYSNEDNHPTWKQHRLKIMKQNPGDDVSVNASSSSKLVKSFSSSPPDTHAGWKRHRLDIINQSPQLNKQSHHSDDVSFDDFVEDIVGGGQVWYDGNKTETSDMLKNWKSKGRRSSETSSTK